MTDRIALVTGASSDIGQAIALGLVGAQARVIATGRSHERLAVLAARHPDALEPVAADLTQDAGRDAVAQAAAHQGRLDLLVIGSGIYARSHDPAVLTQQFAANVQAPYALLQAVLPLLRAASGQVVFINSTQGLNASPEVGQYAATQHALRAIADSLREEVNEQGIRVASIFLGRTASARQAAIFAAEGRRYVPERLIQPEDVAAIVLALFALPPTAEVTNIAMRPRYKPTT